MLAAQEWIWLPLTSALSLGVVYVPAVVWVTQAGQTSITSLLAVNAGFMAPTPLKQSCSLATQRTVIV